MFGSLVVIFPTVHEGGSLLLSDGNDKWTFDSGRELSEKTDRINIYSIYIDSARAVRLQERKEALEIILKALYYNVKL